MRPNHLLVAAFGLILVGSLPLAAAPPRTGSHALRDDADPYYPHKGYPKLITPQWVGESGVDAVVVLAIDDMRDPSKYEKYLRPILDRLKKIDGRAPLSIMTNQVDPADPRLQHWLKEGLSIEVHTISHPCPLLQKGDFAAAERTYHDCVDLMSKIPGNRPVAFRMPCCDSLNTPSPRFYAEIFNKASKAGNFLTIDSSVFMVFTPDDPSLPRDLVLDPDGREKFRKYIPFPSFVNTIENYPYPYIIGGKCWEFPCIVPSDWEAQNLQKPNNPRTVEDLKAALDLVVLKKGVFNLVFHPHGWIGNHQVVELIEHAVTTHGKKVKFLNFREAQRRLDENLLPRPLRNARDAASNIRLVDINRDGYLDVAAGGQGRHEIRTYDPSSGRWSTSAPDPKSPDQPVEHLGSVREDTGVRYVDIDEDGFVDRISSDDNSYALSLFDPKSNDWTRKVMAGKAGEPGALPKIARNGKNNGFWAHSRHLWWQNEDTAALPNHVDRRSFNDLLKHVMPSGKSPEASLKSIRVAPGFQVELMASEPLVADPIALDWGADGKLWVVEMGDYPLGLDGKGKPGGVVRILEDTDGDGRYDKATTFLDGLPFPTGILPWRNGVLIASAPDILYAEDRDGDGKADRREVLFTGFGEGNQQHRLNGFELGLDGWIYGANGDSGGQVKSVRTGRVVNIRGRDFRFRPDTGEFEAESGQTQYGRHRDDWGNWFGNNNPNWGWQYMLAESDLMRNPRYAAPDPRQTLEPDTRLFPVSRTLARFNDPGAANHVTSANSPTPYRDDLFGPHYATSMFVSEPVHNLIHRMILNTDGPTRKGVRGPDESSREFLASSDNWFRPTQLKVGPDGALWISDMYRAVIEHPEWIPAETQKSIDLRAGSREGRIYRVHPVDRKPRPFAPMDKMDTAGLVAALDGPNGWRRDTAQRLLLHGRDPAAIEPLRKLARSNARPQAHVQAAWTLALLGGLDETTAKALLESPHAEVRRNAIKVSELLFKSATPGLAAALAKRAVDPDARVRFELALSLGNWDGPKAGELLARLGRADGDDPWIRAAILSSSSPHLANLLVGLFRDEAGKTPPTSLVEPLVGLAGSVEDKTVTASVVKAIGRPSGTDGKFAPWQFHAARGWLEAAARSGHGDEAARITDMKDLLSAARALVADGTRGEAERLASIALLGFTAAGDSTDRDLLVAQLGPRAGIAAQLAAISALGRGGDPKVPDMLFRGWKSFSPQVRNAILDAVLSRRPWTGTLLSSLEDGCVAPHDVDPSHRQILLGHRDAEFRARAGAIFDKETRSRQQIIETYKPAIARRGDATAGKAAFQKVCAICHKLDDVGIEVGPNLRMLADRSPEAMLTAILDPNRAFEARYANFTVATTDGRVLSGLIASETASAVTLRRQEGKEDVLLRADIEELASSGQSLMPEGIEKDVSVADMSNLIAYLGGMSAAPKSMAGNHPRVVAPQPSGTVVLSAADAEIYGDSLVFEPQYGNLGYWSSANDHAAWRLELPRGGTYAVWLDWACPMDIAGNVLELTVSGRGIRYAVKGTGTWDDYSMERIGQVELPKGPHVLEVRPVGPLKGGLLDLRRIELRPTARPIRTGALEPDSGPEPCSCCLADRK